MAMQNDLLEQVDMLNAEACLAGQEGLMSTPAPLAYAAHCQKCYETWDGSSSAAREHLVCEQILQKWQGELLCTRQWTVARSI